MHRLGTLPPILALIWVAFGCVGTDYIADPPMRIAARVEISPAMAALQIGQQVNLGVVFYDEFGEQDSTVTIEFASLQPEIALPASGGTIQGISLGQTAITVSATDADSILAQATALVTVVEDPTTQLALVRVQPESASLSVGDTVQFQASGHNATGGELPTEDFMWSTSDEAVVTIDNTGVAIARGGGRAQVRAATGGIQSSEIDVFVLVVVEPITGYGFYRVLEQPSVENDYTVRILIDDEWTPNTNSINLVLWAIPQQPRLTGVSQ